MSDSESNSLTLSAGPVCYCQGYKYQSQCNWWIMTPITGVIAVVPGFISLDLDGKLTIFKGYAWDGATDAIDTRDFMRGSFVHDALYQLMREGLLNISHKDTIDRFLITLCREDGMSEIRAAWVYFAIKEFAGSAAERKDRAKFYAGTEPNVA